MKRTARAAVFFLCLHTAFSQVRSVEPYKAYERIVCIVPMIGKGTPDDPRRPMFVPIAGERTEAAKAAVRPDEDQLPDLGIIASGFQESDDGKFAIVEFVARSRAAFKEIVESKDPDVKVYRKERMEKTELSNEIKRFKKDFDIDRLIVEVQ